MLQSSHPGEVVAAASRAVSMLREAGLEFDDIVGGLMPPLDLDAIEARHRGQAERTDRRRAASEAALEATIAKLQAALLEQEERCERAEAQAARLDQERRRQDERLDSIAAERSEARRSLDAAHEELLRVRMQLAAVDSERRRLRQLLEQAGSPAPAWRHNADKRSAVLLLLSDPATAQLSDREIARRAGVSPQTVGNVRRDTATIGPRERKAVRNGKVYTIRVAQIGRKPGKVRRKAKTAAIPPAP